MGVGGNARPIGFIGRPVDEARVMLWDKDRQTQHAVLERRLDPVAVDVFGKREDALGLVRRSRRLRT
jgi:hypothetical protein